MEHVVSQLRESEDFNVIENPLHIETLWNVSNDGEEIEAVGKTEKLRIYFLDLGENYYILFAHNDEPFSYAAFWAWDNEVYLDVLNQFKEKAQEG